MELSGILMGLVELLMAFLFMTLGYLIYYKKKYYLINGYDENKHKEEYSRAIGKSELNVGFLWLICAVITPFISRFFIQFILFFVPIIFIFIEIIKVQKKYFG